MIHEASGWGGVTKVVIENDVSAPFSVSGSESWPRDRGSNSLIIVIREP